VPAFTKAGPKGLVLVATGASKLEQVEQQAHKINPSVKTLAVPTDITDEQAVAQLFEKVKAEFGHADVLISNAGVVGGGGNIHEEDVAGWWRNFVGFSMLIFDPSFIKLANGLLPCRK
jgi:NADP-dependent 3-hydroxy acid dehydrogenase YdfG